MVAKKKTQDVQCYAEVMDSVQTLDAGRRSMYDPDEIEEEQREREQRNKVLLSPNLPLRLWCTSLSVHNDVIHKRVRSALLRGKHANAQTLGHMQPCQSLSLCFLGMCLCMYVYFGSPGTKCGMCSCLQINKIFQQFVRRIQQDVWERDFG